MLYGLYQRSILAADIFYRLCENEEISSHCTQNFKFNSVYLQLVLLL